MRPRFLLERAVRAVVSLFFLASLIFFMTRVIGDPTTALMPIEATPERAAEIRANLGLDRPLIEQYGEYLGRLVVGDFGTSYFWSRPVLDLLGPRIAASMVLAVSAFLVAISIAIPLGVLSAVKRGTRLDSFIRIVAVAGGSIPVFWLGILLVSLFAVQLRLVPTSGARGPSSLILPALTLGLAVSTTLLRLTRSSMLEVLGADYVRLARVKGVSEWIVIWKHGFRNAMLPVVTYSATVFATLLGGAVVTETLFAWPGLGRLLIEGINSRDLPVLQAIIIVIGLGFIVINFVADVSYGYLDPRVRRPSSL